MLLQKAVPDLTLSSISDEMPNRGDAESVIVLAGVCCNEPTAYSAFIEKYAEGANFALPLFSALPRISCFTRTATVHEDRAMPNGRR